MAISTGPRGIDEGAGEYLGIDGFLGDIEQIATTNTANGSLTESLAQMRHVYLQSVCSRGGRSATPQGSHDPVALDHLLGPASQERGDPTGLARWRRY